MLDEIDINTHVLDAGHFEKGRVMYLQGTICWLGFAKTCDGKKETVAGGVT